MGKDYGIVKTLRRWDAFVPQERYIITIRLPVETTAAEVIYEWHCSEMRQTVGYIIFFSRLENKPRKVSNCPPRQPDCVAIYGNLINYQSFLVSCSIKHN